MFTISKNALLLLFLWVALIYFPSYIVSDSNSIAQISFFLFYLTLLVLFCLLLENPLVFTLPDKGLSIVFFTFVCIALTFIPKVPTSNLVEFVNHSRFLFYFLVFVTSYQIMVRLAVPYEKFLYGLNIIVISLVIFNLIHLIYPQAVSVINNRPIWGFRGISVGGPFVWSYIFSFFLLPVFFVYFHLTLLRFNFVRFVLLTCVLILLLLGQSKACYLALVVCLLNYFIVAFLTNKVSRKKLVFIFLFFSFLITSALVMLPELFSAIIEGFTSILEGRIDASTSGRIRQITIATEALSSGDVIPFIFGEDVPVEVIENAYFSYFYKYGVVGLFSLILFYGYLIFVSYKYLFYALIRNYSDISVAIFFAFNATTLSLIFFSAGSSPIDANKSSFFFFLFWSTVIYLKEYQYHEKKLPIYH